MAKAASEISYESFIITNKCLSRLPRYAGVKKQKKREENGRENIYCRVRMKVWPVITGSSPWMSLFMID